MNKLTGKQKAYLRGLAHSLNPVVQIGRNGLTDSTYDQIDEALKRHELIKVKYVDWKDEKKELSEKISEKLNCEICGSIGHIYIFFRQNSDPEKRKIIIKG
jgi:RNA-binding protein